jgi:hypothetical protein
MIIRIEFSIGLQSVKNILEDFLQEPKTLTNSVRPEEIHRRHRQVTLIFFAFYFHHLYWPAE